jgi:hypothetical protein
MGNTGISPTFVTDVAYHLRLWCRGLATPRMEERLIGFAVTMAGKKLWGRLHAAARVENVTVKEIARSFLGELFSGDPPRSLLATAIADDLDCTDEQLFCVFESIVVNAVVYANFRHWRTNDPVGARLWNNLRKVLRSNPRFHLFPSDQPVWVTTARESELLEDMPPVDKDELQRLASSLPSHAATLGDYVYSILSEIAALSDRCRAVKIGSVFTAIRELFVQEVKRDQDTPGDASDIGPELKVTIDAARRSILTETVAITSQYQEAGKLTALETRALTSAAGDLLKDYCDFGEETKLFIDYLRTYVPGLTEAIYRERFKTRFEYLARYCRRRLCEILREKWR